jgi:hypothetical protein
MYSFIGARHHQEAPVDQELILEPKEILALYASDAQGFLCFYILECNYNCHTYFTIVLGSV